MASSNGKNTQIQQQQVEGNNPLETKYIEQLDRTTGESFKVKALCKIHVPHHNFRFIKFYLPKLCAVEEDLNIAVEWAELMNIFCDDLKWLLEVPHHVFWSVILYKKEFREEILSSFLSHAPRAYDEEFQAYLQHQIIGPLYNEIYQLVFRIFLRLSVYKENKDEYFTVGYWSKLVYDYSIFDMPKTMELCALYENSGDSGNPTFVKMLSNVYKSQPKILQSVEYVIPLQLTKIIELDFDLEERINDNTIKNYWDYKTYRELLLFRIDMFYLQYKFLKVSPVEAAAKYHKYPEFELNLAASYEKNCFFWDKVTKKIPRLCNLFVHLKTYMLNCIRMIIVNPTIYDEKGFNNHKLNEYFTSLTNILHEKRLIHDLEMCYPLKEDLKQLVSRGIYIDETQFDFLSSAIADCFKELGKTYNLEKIITDPYYDPSFDRQQLGACSLDMTGIELQSLITQVKDLLGDMPDPYIEVCLKHYEYSTEKVINAILENSVPARLQKYKSEEYLRSAAGRKDVQAIEHQHQPVENGLKLQESKKKSDEEAFLDKGKEVKDLVLKSLEISNGKREEISSSSITPYLDVNLLPNSYSYYNEDNEYNDEYDDSYDGIGMGMSERETEPELLKAKFLNVKACEMENAGDYEEVEEEKPKNLNNFVEDPAVLRAQYERRREEKYHQRNKNPHPQQQQQQQQQQQPANRDVVGKAKGQGQDKEVVYNRRQKTENKNSNRKKQSDWKRREF